MRAAVFTAIVGVMAAVPAAADIPDNVLGPAFFYDLIGFTLVAGGGPAPINPGVLVGLNPQPLPPLPDPNASLNLGNPGGPVYDYPGGPAEVFQISWGMDAGGAVSFGPVHPGPDPGQFGFGGVAPGGDPYAIMFTITGASPGSFVELNPQPLPPFPAPNFGFEVFQFETPAGIGDPSLTFNVSSGNTVFGFDPVPEPSSSSLGVLTIAGVLWVLRRRKVAAGRD